MTTLLISLLFSTILTAVPVLEKETTKPSPKRDSAEIKHEPESFITTNFNFFTNGYEAQISLIHKVAPYPLSLGISYSGASFKYEETEYSSKNHTLYHNNLAGRVAYQGQKWRAGLGFHSYLTSNIPTTRCSEVGDVTSESIPLAYCPDTPASDPRQFHFFSIFATFGNEADSMLSLEVTSELNFSLIIQYKFKTIFPFFKLDRLFNFPFNNISNHREQLYHGEIGFKSRAGKSNKWMIRIGFFVKGGYSTTICEQYTNGNLNELKAHGVGFSFGVQYGY